MAKSIIALLLALGLGLSGTTGCIGGNAVTGKVREFNLRVAKGKWPREAVFLLLTIIPVYGFAALADIFVINGIEFLTGKNPVSGKPRIARVGETLPRRGAGWQRVAVHAARGRLDRLRDHGPGRRHAAAESQRARRPPGRP